MERTTLAKDDNLQTRKETNNHVKCARENNKPHPSWQAPRQERTFLFSKKLLHLKLSRLTNGAVVLPAPIASHPSRTRCPQNLFFFFLLSTLYPPRRPARPRPSCAAAAAFRMMPRCHAMAGGARSHRRSRVRIRWQHVARADHVLVRSSVPVATGSSCKLVSEFRSCVPESNYGLAGIGWIKSFHFGFSTCYKRMN